MFKGKYNIKVEMSSNHQYLFNLKQQGGKYDCGFQGFD
jgi:hypothetical protein